jgi:short-subunit dehydrogenase
MKTVLVTGASSGIGETLARKFSQRGYHVVLVARSTHKLTALAEQLESTTGNKVTVQTADLSRTGAAEKLATTLKNLDVEIDILINCAGVLEHGSFVDMTPAMHKGVIDLNISGLTEMLSYFLPPMIARGHGRVLNVASIAAFQPIPSLATYAATKAYVLSLTESLAEELTNTGVTITALCPGITATNMLTTAKEKEDGLNIPSFIIGDADDVAEQGYNACLKGDVICVPGSINLAATLAGRATPKWLLRKVTGFMGRYALGKNKS